MIFGGVGQNPQVQALARGVDILVATPGRLLDLMGQGHVRLERLEVFVLDEADRMLDMGFIHDVRRVIAALPRQRQTLFFSATMPPEIAALADGILTDPVRVGIRPVVSTAERIEQRVMLRREGRQAPAAAPRAARTRRSTACWSSPAPSTAPTAWRSSSPRTASAADAIHGNKSQNARTRALDRFRSGAARVLVATDIAARGIDVDGITHVVNYDLPNVPESYVHRIGRTARAGDSGIAISFCDAEERAYLRDIEALIKARIPVVADHPWHSAAALPAAPAAAPQGAQPRPRRSQRRPPGRSAGGGAQEHEARGAVTALLLERVARRQVQSLPGVGLDDQPRAGREPAVAERGQRRPRQARAPGRVEEHEVVGLRRGPEAGRIAHHQPDVGRRAEALEVGPRQAERAWRRRRPAAPRPRRARRPRGRSRRCRRTGRESARRAAAGAPCSRMPNRASRARSLVGRIARSAGVSSLRPRQVPAMIRMIPDPSASRGARQRLSDRAARGSATAPG